MTRLDSACFWDIRQRFTKKMRAGLNHVFARLLHLLSNLPFHTLLQRD